MHRPNLKLVWSIAFVLSNAYMSARLFQEPPEGAWHAVGWCAAIVGMSIGIEQVIREVLFLIWLGRTRMGFGTKGE